MWMESERIMHPVFREFYAERDVVFEERDADEINAAGKFQEEFMAMFWESCPYACGRGLALGRSSHLQSASRRVLLHLLFAAEHHAHLVGDSTGQSRGAGHEVFRAHPARPENSTDVVTPK